MAVVTYVAWIPADIITTLLTPQKPRGWAITLVTPPLPPMSPVHDVIDDVADHAMLPVLSAICMLAWLAARRTEARTQLRIGAAAFAVLVAEMVFAEADEMLDAWRRGEPMPFDYEPASLVWYYAPAVLVMAATWSGTRRAWSIAGLPGSYRPARRTKVALTTVVVLLLATEAAPPPAAPPPIAEPWPSPVTEPQPTPVTEPVAEVEGIGCRPERRRPVVRPPRRRVTARVNAEWDRLDRWLAENAPRTFKELNQPAQPRDIAEAEARMGVRFPDDLKASLLRHDGARFGKGSFFFVYRLSSLKEIVADWRTTCEVIDGDVPAGAKEPKGYVDPEGFWWHGSAIPFAMDGGGDSMVLDGRGRVGSFFNEGGLTFTGEWAWPSYMDFLEDVADALERGKPLRRSLPTATPEGDLEWS